MALTKVTYQNGDILYAQNLNDIQDEVIANASAISAKYSKPGDGIPSSDLASDVQTNLGKANLVTGNASLATLEYEIVSDEGG